MLRFVLNRIMIMIPAALLISIISFIVMQLPPGDLLTIYQARIQESGARMEQEVVERFKEIYQLDKPLYVQYLAWIKGIILHGDFGYSIMYRGNVSDLIWEGLASTIALTGLTMLLAYGFGIAIGVYSAIRPYSLADHVFTVLGFLGLAIPDFFMALLLMYVAVVFFGAESITGFFSNYYLDLPWSVGKFVDLMKHLWIPVLVIGSSRTAGIIRIVRANLMDVLGKQYVTTARAKGIHERIVIYKHALRNAINPLISLMGMELPAFLTGSMIASIVLGLPTAGRLLHASLMNQDMQMGASIILLMSLLLMLGNLGSDILLVLVDPRIRFD